MMTERIHPLSPPFATTTILPLSNAVTPILTREISQAVTDGEDGEDADYTIKCICGFDDDDGNTVYCEPCDSWQHILCFYPHDPDAPNRDDFLHKCHECQPRALDPVGAKRRQISNRLPERAIREADINIDGRDNGIKNKKPPSKSHKKKRNPSELNLNGFDPDKQHNHKKGSLHDPSTQPKKSKAHRSHASISSHAPKRSPSHNNGHPPSPANTPPDLPEDFRLHDHNPQLQSLYDSDAQPLETNDFAHVDLVSKMSLWATDKQKLREITGQEDVEGIIRVFKNDFNYSAYPWPKLEVKTEDVGSKVEPLRIRYITPTERLSEERLVGELKGLVGIQRDFTDNSDFFKRLSHAPPFVYFHTDLPLYIDTRTEGSQCRYTRRSCRPTCSIDTFTTNTSEYHFVLVSERAINPGDQITLPWEIRFPPDVKHRYNSLLLPSQSDGNRPVADATDEEYELLSEFTRNLLTEFGGCACGLGNNCSFVKFHRNYHARVQTQTNGVKPKKSRKPKNHISPTSTGHATNSRDVSEGRQDQVDEDDSRSTSGSVRSKPQSRDMTPSGQGPETNGTSEPMISEREKRKIEAAEKRFEQDQPPRKKKRSSDGPQPSAGVTSTQPPQKKSKSISKPTQPTQLGQSNGSRQYKDASTSRQHSNSPSAQLSPPAGVSPRSRLPSQAPSMHERSRQPSVSRSNYVDASIQTDPSMDTDSWYSPPKHPLPKRKVVPLATRLLQTRVKTNAIRDSRRAEEAKQKAFMDSQSVTSENRGSLSPTIARRMSVMSANDTGSIVGDEDVAMQDAASVLSATKSDPPSWPESLPTPGLPASATRLSPELKVQMPPIPSFANVGNSVPATPNGAITPSSATGSIPQSPFGSVHLPTAFSPQVLNSVGQNPSPIKKKLSLSDYKARLKKPAVTTPLGTEAIPEESKTGILEDSTIVETPAVDAKSSDPIADAGSELPETNSPEVSNADVIMTDAEITTEPTTAT